jgi:hypothetical protein
MTRTFRLMDGSYLVAWLPPGSWLVYGLPLATPQAEAVEDTVRRLRDAADEIESAAAMLGPR